MESLYHAFPCMHIRSIHKSYKQNKQNLAYGKEQNLALKYSFKEGIFFCTKDLPSKYSATNQKKQYGSVHDYIKIADWGQNKKGWRPC